jgi:transcriptional regulator with XRE-family HTH domain
MPVATAEKVRALSQDLGSQRKLAELLEVSPAQVTRWLKGQGIDDLNADRVDLLEVVMSQLLRLYSPRAAALWRVGLNPHLRDRRPIDVIRHGRAREVLDAIAAARAGSYA